ncbi:hypothetical protein N7456_007541 [Penicillium angulare]|uniref:Tachykinin family protein n=1 Tax=Penicillium angulare TaxID=116970 RepID=A0A9W9FB38_9EURO|nr:hypothetical protein N7456_007541 [Penicillium angulare]
MSSTEVIFPVRRLDDNIPPCVFRYDAGPTASKAPKKRGRPKGSTKHPVALKKNGQSARSGSSLQNRFHFIRVDGPSGLADADHRKTIRREVMINHIHRDKKQLIKGKGLSVSGTRGPCSQIGGVDPFNALPIHFEPYMHDLLKYYITEGWQKYYSIERQTTFNPITEYWLSLLMEDDAFLHTVLGCANSHYTPVGIDYDSLATLKHLNAAIAIVNRRIQNDEVPTDATLVVISTMALIEKRRGYEDHWNIHMKGLQKLISLRGGLSSLRSQPLAMGKLYRADLVGSIDAVQTPYFSNPGILISVDPQLESLNIGFQRLNDISPLGDTLISCIQTAADIKASLVKLNKTSDLTEAATVRYWTTATQYTLLSTAYSNPIPEMCRLALLLFTEELVNQSVPFLFTYETLIGKLLAIYASSAPESRFHPGTCYLPPHLRLWAFILAAKCTTVELTRKACLGAVAGALLEMEISDDEAVRFAVEELLWDTALEKGRPLDVGDLAG